MLLYVPSDGATAIAVLYSNMVLEPAYGDKVSSVGFVSRKRTKKTTSAKTAGVKRTEKKLVGRYCRRSADLDPRDKEAVARTRNIPITAA